MAYVQCSVVSCDCCSSLPSQASSPTVPPTRHKGKETESFEMLIRPKSRENKSPVLAFRTLLEEYIDTLPPLKKAASAALEIVEIYRVSVAFILH